MPAPGDPGLAEALGRGLVDGEADAAGASALEALPGGPGLATALAALSPAQVGDATLIEGIAAFERLASWATAQQAVLVRELTDRHGTTGTAAKTAAAEIGARLGSTGTVGAMKVDLAAALDSFPEVADALTTGRIDSRKATVLTTREPGLTTGQQRRVVTGLLKDADRLSGPKLRNRLRAAALSVNPDAGVERRQREHAARKVTITPAPDAMAWITAYVRADHAHTIKTALRALADAAVDGDQSDERTREQVQADAFVDLFASVLDRGVDLAGHPLPSGRLARAGAQITVGAGTLLGLDHQAGYLAGYGPIPAELARELAQDATWRALLTDEHGHFKDLSTKAYRPGADLTRTVRARDVTCTFPGCNRPSVVCDLDHRIAYDPAIAHLVAQTSVCNLHPLCRRHHNLKTSKRWDVVREPDGTVIWTVARTGHRYRHTPDPPAGAPAAANRWADLFANTDPPF
ncbi:HNH endonuclease signature motif containing protein [Georgenia soli]|uniref:HNH endonuclease signature motif containing protein n=1 Tax=Georgenia soli TaxID=638953 RepID=UPI00117BB910|nr:HNH endonuclease signature motif containing protein [Georgenia soli]